MPVAEAQRHVRKLLGEEFRQAQVFAEDTDIQIRVTPKEQVTIRRTPPTKSTRPLDHNKQKQYIIPEGEPCAFLQRLGVMNADGRVKADKYDKFRQINRFLEMVDDVMEALPKDRALQIVDFGCGKSYLTFALYHYLQSIKQLPVNIIGLDLKEDVIAHCQKISDDLGFGNLNFQIGSIGSFTPSISQIDMVVSLHACDTATDDVLIQAVGWKASVILSVPCCQHELFDQVDNLAMKPLVKHGIIKHHLSSLITDAVRANLLEIAGYRVQLLEFISVEHTPKNILIRAVKTKLDPKTQAELFRQYEEFRDYWHVTPYLENKLMAIVQQEERD